LLEIKNRILNDRDLLKRLKKDDGKAFEELFRKYFFALMGYAKFYTGNAQIAEDMVHDVFYRIWEIRKSMEVHTSIKSYLYRAVHNNSIQYLRHQKVIQNHNKIQQAKLEEALILNKLYFETGLGKLFEMDINDMVDKAINKLPEKTGKVYILSRKKNNNNSEIAKELNISEKAVEYHITKALSLLRAVLKEYL
jgi:RNA polymerase sigma-70 factor, ECF subfamily